MLTAKELVEYARNWRPTEEDTGRAIERLIARDKEFAKEQAERAKFDLNYVYNV